MRVYGAARGVDGFVDSPAGWPGAASGWPSTGVLAGLADAMAEATQECPICPDAPPGAFLLGPRRGRAARWGRRPAQARRQAAIAAAFLALSECLFQVLSPCA
jgi:hypothetical protein